MKLTPDEERAIRLLKELARVWPKSIKLFSWDGNLKVMKPKKELNMLEAVVEDVPGIPNDGGDPQWYDPSK